MSEMKSRRKITNLILDPKALLQLSIPFIVLTLISVGTVVLIHWRVMRAIEQTALFGVENIDMMNTLHDMQGSITWVGILGLLIFCVVCIGLWIYFSHKIFGPMVPIRRHVQSLAEGQYDSRIHPRAGDQFQELIEDLNHLAETLAQKRR